MILINNMVSTSNLNPSIFITLYKLLLRVDFYSTMELLGLRTDFFLNYL